MVQIYRMLEQIGSPARKSPKSRSNLRIALVQEKWHGSVQAQQKAIRHALQSIKEDQPHLIILSELTLYPYGCTRPIASGDFLPEPLFGQSYEFASELAKEFDAAVVISLFEAADDEAFNTAIIVAPDGEIVSKTRKTHLPITAGYYEDKYFNLGDTSPLVAEIEGARVGTPTCWDQWFPELAREYGLLGADLLCYPTAIGSEPDFPAFDTEPLWRQMMVAHGIANGYFVAAVNRIGIEDGVTFYGSSFISDPYGRVLVQAGRDESAVIIAELDLDQKRDWLDLFPFFQTRRPEMYRNLGEKKSPTP